MILEFGKYARSAFYFDCFLSAYDMEKEYLFIGGFAALKIKNLLHFISDTEKVENYSEYLALVEVFLSIVTNKISPKFFES